MEEHEYITVNEVARSLRVGRWAVYGWIREGKLRAVRTPGGHIRIRKADLPQPTAAQVGVPA
jgi:excisionase family DNA binding protein